MCGALTDINAVAHTRTANYPRKWVSTRVKVDPTFHHHGLRHHGFTVAISWWAGHDKADMQLGEKGKRTVVDFRGVDVRVDDYRNGSVHVACPPRSHDYYVLRDGRMQPCQCISNWPHLNCQNRPATKQQLSFRAAHGTT